VPANIEIKARIVDMGEFRRRAEALSGRPCEFLQQEDTFFHVAAGRLKLRVLAPDHGQLIYYRRPDQPGPKRSDYDVAETDQPETLKHILGEACGTRGVVRKARALYLIGQTRIHLDEVEGLGQFMELEVVLRPGQPDADGQAIAAELMAKLGVNASDLVDSAYIDMLQSQI